MIALFSICIFGFSYLVYDYFNIVNRTTMPEDFAKTDQTVRNWQSSGLVYRFDALQGKLVVNEDKWNVMTKQEKIGIVTQLARYCADQKKTDNWAFEVVGNRTSSVVGQLGARGLVIQ
ncbi:MAG TPA: hypothetical protein VI758_05370 [Bacteroidota bacterium]